jgi:hypothetical protein
MIRRVINIALKRGFETAVQATAETAATAASKSFEQWFTVTLPATVYVRASQCNLTIRYRSGDRVELAANLRASFGWELAADQDSAGVYIVAKRKPVVGKMSTARFTLTVPPGVNLVLHLTPGSVRLENIDGKLAIPGSIEQPETSLVKK